MSDVEQFKGLVEQLRAVAERTPEQRLSPIAETMQAETDGGALRFLKGIYIAGGLRVMPDAIQGAIEGGVSPRALVAALDSVVAFHEKHGDTS